MFDELRDELLRHFVPGSDPGLAIAPREKVGLSVQSFAARCQRELVRLQDALDLARSCGIRLEGLGGTHGGVIGALAALGLAATGNDGRVVVQAEWGDDWGGVQSIPDLARRAVSVREWTTNLEVDKGLVEVGKKLRPNLRGDRVVLFVERAQPTDGSRSEFWRALKLA